MNQFRKSLTLKISEQKRYMPLFPTSAVVLKLQSLQCNVLGYLSIGGHRILKLSTNCFGDLFPIFFVNLKDLKLLKMKNFAIWFILKI